MLKRFSFGVTILLLCLTITFGAAFAEKMGGTLTIACRQTLSHLNPMLGKGIYGYYATNSIFDSLITVNPETLEPAPFVAKSWAISEDAKEFTFYLNEGISFTNGESLTADDVKFTIDWTLDPDNASPQASNFKWVDRVEAVDDYTVKIYSKDPFPAGLTSLVVRIVPHDTFEEIGAEDFDSNPVGSGPFMLEEWVKGSQVVLVRNSDYWLKTPNLDKVVIRVIPETTTAELELEQGGVDITDTLLPQDIEHFESLEHINVEMRTGLNTQFLGFSSQLVPYSNLEFRKAVIQSFDMDEAVKAIFPHGGATRAYGMVPPPLWANDEPWLMANSALSEDDDAAEATFARLKRDGVIPADFKAVVYSPPDPNRRKMATIIATNLQQNGLDVEVSQLEFGAYLELLFAGECGMFLIGWVGVSTSLDPYEFLSFMFRGSDSACTSSGYNLTCYENDVVDLLLGVANTNPDFNLRETMYVAVQRIAVGQDYAMLPAYHEALIRGVNKRVQDYFASSTEMIPFQLCSPFNNVWLSE